MSAFDRVKFSANASGDSCRSIKASHALPCLLRLIASFAESTAPSTRPNCKLEYEAALRGTVASGGPLVSTSSNTVSGGLIV